MSDSFLKECGGFTPIPDALIKKYKNSDIALVWGTVWRYWQRPDKSKPPSQETMAARAGISRRTFIEYLNQLIEDGFIDDLDPGVRNRPHLYSTDKGEELIRGMQFSHTDSSIPDDRYANSAQDNDVGMRNLHTGYAEDAHQEGLGMQISHKKIEESNPIESIIDNPITSPIGEGGLPPTSPVKIPEPIPKVEYTEFEYSFLTYFSAKRFKNPTQHKTIAGLIALHGETEIDNLAQWAAKRGMGLGQAIPAIESALKNPKRKDRQNGATKNGQHSKQPTEKPDLTNPDTWAAQLEAASGKRSPS